MLSSLLISLALAHPADPLLQALPAPANNLVSCASLGAMTDLLPLAAMVPDDAFNALLAADSLQGVGVDPAAPFFLATGSDRRSRHLGIQIGLHDSRAFEASGILTELSERGAHWAISDDSALVFLSVPRDGGDPTDGLARLGVGRMLDAVDPSEPGCSLAIDLSGRPPERPQVANAGVLLHMDADAPDHMRLRIYDVALPDMVYSTLEGRRPRRSALVGTSATPPAVVLRVNLDLVHWIETMSESGLPPVGQMARDVRDSGVRLAPGAMLGLTPGERAADMQIVAIFPLKRPLRAKRMLNAIIEKAAERGTPAAWDGELVRIEDAGPGALWFGASGRNLVVGTSPEQVRDVINGTGEPWVDASYQDMMRSPGIFAYVDYVRPELIASLPTSFELGLTESAMVARVVEPGVIELEMIAPGFIASLQTEIVERMVGTPTPEAPPEKEPESSESAAILSLIASRENELKRNGGAYMPYSGGPRAMEALDQSAVPWEGIPALGIEPMQTACRYEVNVGPDSFTARGICDEDDDGAFAIRVVGASGVPERVTPEGVR